MRLIDADKLIEEILGEENQRADQMQSERYAEMVKRQKTVDAEPVVDAHWQKHDNGNKPWTCSACGSGCLLNYESDWCLSERCPHCGAKMNGGTEKDE